MRRVSKLAGALGSRTSLALSLLALGPIVAPLHASAAHMMAAEALESVCFPQTSQCLLPPFLDAWRSHGELNGYGLPLSHEESVITAVRGTSRTLQWFEFGRLETTDIFDARTGAVTMGGLDSLVEAPLGIERLRQLGQDWQTYPKGDPAAPHYFAETGQAVDDVFWAYWSAARDDDADPSQGSVDQGIARFGRPISPTQATMPVGKPMVLVQWFERARLEYNVVDGTVSRASIGQEEFAALNGEFPRSALTRLNVLRAAAGAAPLEMQPQLTASATNTRDYLLLNGNDDDPRASPHEETEGFPGFTGRDFFDRVRSTGFPWPAGGEDIWNGLDPVHLIDGLVAAPFHRLALLDPRMQSAGIAGFTSRSWITPSGYVLTSNPAVVHTGGGPATRSAQPSLFASPADGQTGVPSSWDGRESPSPLPEGVQGLVAYPFILYALGSRLTVDFADLQDASGASLPVFPNGCKTPGCLVLIGKSPLHPRMLYSVRVKGTQNTVAFDRIWHFAVADEDAAT